MKTEISPTATALVALMKLKGLGRRGALRIVNDTIDDASRSDYCKALNSWLSRNDAGISKNEFLNVWTNSLNQLNKDHRAGIKTVSFHDEEYPKRLREIPDPPAVLFVKGDIEALRSTKSLAIVGTREPTQQGEKIAYRTARTASEAGFVVVSGLAHGCDTRAHNGCLEAGGVGVAVLAHGLDRVYPAANRDLADRLVEQGGCLVSEYPVGTRPTKSAFVERDRIQSGLSEAVLVIETGINGGTMHTVQFARNQKRVLACIDYTKQQLCGENKAEGNRKLLEDEAVKPIWDRTAFTQFLNELKSNLSDESSEEQKEAVDPQQLSLAFSE